MPHPNSEGPLHGRDSAEDYGTEFDGLRHGWGATLVRMRLAT